MTESIFEPMENNLSLFLYGTGRAIDGVSLAEAIEMSGARIIGCDSLGSRRVFLLEESHVYIDEGEPTVFQLCTCGRTCPPNSIPPLMDIFRPSGARVVYYQGVPLVGTAPSFDFRSVVAGWDVEDYRSDQGQVFVAKRHEPGGISDDYVGISLKGCFDLRLFDACSLRASLLENLLSLAGIGVVSSVEHEFKPGYTGVFLGREGCLAVHTTPECYGSYRGVGSLNFASVHVHGKRVDALPFIDFFSAMFADVFRLSAEGYSLEERVAEKFSLNV